MSQSKKCVYCEVVKSINQFPKHKMMYDGYDTRCKSCISIRSKILREIKKNAPPKPDACECCGKVLEKKAGHRNTGLACDHDPETNEFRGWICQQCNTGIGKLGDDIEGLWKAILYLERAKVNSEVAKELEDKNEQD